MVSDGEGNKKDKEKDRKKRQHVSIIARPLAGKRLCKKTLKLVRRAAQNKQLRRGVKEVVKAVRRGQKGLCVIAGDISPIDVITHLPILCEESDIPYIYVPSKEDLGGAAAQKRPACCMLVLLNPVKGKLEDEEKQGFMEDYTDVSKEVKSLASTIY
ncbi:hypothetical protein SELMODRAFT_163432 [Selaginella moellendorffii]|uniref:H/ACA ribonucleoprotein complex subunit 2 n=1 Tax=Selaginella moellendorffii TaxID=88036 RepID=D8TFQ9_SELML|nr:H/ACA ribonucleoprotein complex subunit 2-like protein [Selaginella moellendorffii]XP_024533456.1 H/ACA ribonucleoprotein complex subunit 2-like protein [Selaginella moellendorffii]EFJ04509.1 hypothetical protein SELMODRAFT_163432 [Selaginella moellendorffii]|eukprot:XP_002994430.1 H/ACA ribonucleoprotein complex subunit 2-like protein [Selaginella moellendorffii]